MLAWASRMRRQGIYRILVENVIKKLVGRPRIKWKIA
jgi:hypothetical protein